MLHAHCMHAAHMLHVRNVHDACMMQSMHASTHACFILCQIQAIDGEIDKSLDLVARVVAEAEALELHDEQLRQSPDIELLERPPMLLALQAAPVRVGGVGGWVHACVRACACMCV